jgi:signal transduction histidine kinase
MFLILSCNSNKEGKGNIETKRDSISTWIKKSKNLKISLLKRRQYLDKSYEYILFNNIDSTSLKNLSEIAYQTFKVRDTFLFKKRNEKVISLALINKDSFSLGDAHWSYATFYNRLGDYENSYFHFNEAQKYFKNYVYYVGKMLVGKSFIKGRFSDYMGSEQDIIKAVKIFKKHKKYDELLSCYTSLGVIQSNLKSYDKSLFYYKKALKYSVKSKNKNKLSLNNNIGLVYLEKGEIKKAISLFKRDITTNLRRDKPREYARIIDNIAYSKLHFDDTLGIKKDFYTSLFIRDSLKNKEGILTSKIHISEYYIYLNDTTKAIRYAKDANKIAKQVKNSRDYLTSLKLLSSLDKKNANHYLENYISYSDSLQTLQRNYQNKFARISHDTDEYIEETERLSEQRIWIISISISIFLIVLLTYFLRVQKVKTEKLLLETEQQKSNEQVYLLTLHHQSKLEEEKIKERNRISEELHDGVLGRLFGTRVGLGFIALDAEEKNKKKYQLFLDELQNIEKEIRKVSHKLNDNFDDSDVDFMSIIRQLILNKSESGNFNYKLDFDIRINWYHVDGKIKVNLYRIIQEAFLNIIKYANAKNVYLNFDLENNSLTLYLSDDGVGFDIKKRRNGIGLKNIKSRVKKLDGICEISSTLNKGTEINIQIPLL